MQANLKCSHCGAEISNLTLSWGKKQWLYMLPCILIAPLMFLPVIWLRNSRGEISKDLTVGSVEKRVNGSNIEIVGIVTNHSKNRWEGVNVEVEFYDDAGKFVDEERSFLNMDIQPSSDEHFKIIVHSSDPTVLEGNAKAVVKISSGRTSPF